METMSEGTAGFCCCASGGSETTSTGALSAGGAGGGCSGGDFSGMEISGVIITATSTTAMPAMSPTCFLEAFRGGPSVGGAAVDPNFAKSFFTGVSVTRPG